MKLQLTKTIFATVLLFISFLPVRSQLNICPPNLDFEFGNFNNWECKTGSCSATSGQNVITWTGCCAPVSNRHEIIPGTSGAIDPYGLFPIVCPNGSGYSVKLGNNQTGAQAEGLFYTYTIPLNIAKFSIFYWYAVVFQDPGHPPQQQPRFIARIIDVATNQPINCVTFDIISTSSLPGFQRSPINPLVIFKDWTPVTLDLTSYRGKTIRIEFITEDCTQSGHFGYAYVDVNSGCSGAIAGTTVCGGDSAANLTAPFGFQSYQWYSDITFTTPLANTQIVTISPAPPQGNIYPVIVTPYPSYGCVDTLYAAITTGAKPVSNAGPDVISCQYESVQIGGAATPLYGYVWTPANLLNNPTLPNPTATIIGANPVTFIVKTIDSVSTCYSYDTTIVTPYTVDTSISILGKSNYCVGESLNTTYLLNPAITATQWFWNSNPIPGAVATTYQPNISGVYWAAITQNGCSDSTQATVFTIHPLPVADFSINKDIQCITNNSFSFNNLATVGDNAQMNFLWHFSDGTTDPSTSPTKTFATVGNFTVNLLVTTVNGCTDNISKPVATMTNGKPDFSWDSICTNRSGWFKNMSNENGAPSANYLWDFKNGDISTLKTPLAVVYNQPGIYDVALSITTTGCQTQPITISKKVIVNESTPAIRYPDLTVVEGYSKYIHVRSTVGNIYNWQPQIQLNKYAENYPLFTAVNDVKYLIAITDQHTCVTIDTMQIFVLKKPGYYLPTAFTPNGDGKNDVVRPYVVGLKGLKSFSIYNRAGSLVFHTTTAGEGWDGKYKGEKQPPAVYVWLLEYFDSDNKVVTAKGTLTLIR